MGDIEHLTELLKEEVKRLKQIENHFPFDCCSLASESLLLSNGFPIVYGRYQGLIDERYYRITQRERQLTSVIHEFSYDLKTRIFIDITASQFHSTNPDILLMPQQDPRIALGFNSITPLTTHLVLICQELSFS